MPTLKVLNGYGKYQDDDALYTVISYIWKPYKIPHHIIGGTNVDLDHPVESMIAHAMNFNKYSRTRLRHYVLSFEPYADITLGLLARVAAFISEDIGKAYPNVYALHEDKDHYHIHFVVSPIAMNGHRYRGNVDEYHNLQFMFNIWLHGFNLGMVVPVKYNPQDPDDEE